MTEEVVVVATMRPSPEHAQRVREVLTELVGRVHQEQGCLLYALHSAKDGSLVMLERWASNDALRAHAGGEPAAWSNGQLQGLLESEPEIVLLRAVPAGDASLGAI